MENNEFRCSGALHTANKKNLNVEKNLGHVISAMAIFPLNTYLIAFLICQLYASCPKSNSKNSFIYLWPKNMTKISKSNVCTFPINILCQLRQLFSLLMHG